MRFCDTQVFCCFVFGFFFLSLSLSRKSSLQIGLFYVPNKIKYDEV